MGAYLSQIPASRFLNSQCLLIGLSIAKLREIHGSFKSICDNFVMNLTQFEQIFNSDSATFTIFDTDNNGLIDALEIFTGLIVFSASKAEDKMRFLFDIYDFNEIQTISLLDLEFMVQCILTATKKIFDLKNNEISEMEIL